MIKLLSRLMGSEQPEELKADALVQEIEDIEASRVSGGWDWCLPWNGCWW